MVGIKTVARIARIARFILNKQWHHLLQVNSVVSAAFQMVVSAAVIQKYQTLLGSTTNPVD